MLSKTGIFFTVILLFFSCKKAEEYQFINGNALGTSFTVKYNKNENYSTAIDSLFKVVNHSLSTYHSNSIISKINNGEHLIEVDQHFKIVFEKAKRIYKETDAYFDPTIGILVNAWGFGPKKAIENLDSLQVSKLMKYVGFEKVSLIENYVEKQYPEIFIDFNAIAKGYAVDVLAQFLESKNTTDYMVEIGGEIRVRGVNPNGEDWVIGVEKPFANTNRETEMTLRLHDKSMATSGNYRKFKIDKTGRKFVHTINPKTGFTEQNNLLSASVVSTKDCADVDGYATAFMAMGYERTLLFLKNHTDLEVVLIYVDEHGEFRIESTVKETY